MSAITLHRQSRGEGPALVILHGLYGSGPNWNPQARRLLDRYRVIQPDLRNHGRSPHAEPMDYPAMAEDLRALLDEEALEQAIILGHSMGGKAAMTLALQAPERVRALVVADIAPVPYRHTQGHRQIIDALLALDTAALNSREEADQALANAIPETLVRQFLLTNLVRGAQGYHWRIPLARLRAALPNIEGFPAFAEPYPGPALFIHGGASDYLAPEHEATVHRLFPQARLETLAGAGHWLHVEQPEVFADALESFLQEL
ncbi:alpha/beta fold hydrolase [Alkalilimnicola sp. S0819]|uniref:alpha/beta fold hydrolase n=1 Tax=Alkalilimnicola sp. S0819 TaxID=2613922 RepID=UPI0012615B5B|nr:alpha/beta fold hydrolase [Alkalilimnicola sp. S0819]KAB7622677.1 alpha/beta fold hydrolase [Alkalilimnicola sp. S0819]MPQ17314.1 alpha/beta fold hydrolase [Alkalilimnicola sp. S0819]